MAYNNKRENVRVYFQPEEKEQLKKLAKAKGVSLTELVRKTVLERTSATSKCEINPETNLNELSKEDLLYIILQEEKIIHRLVSTLTASIYKSM